MFAKKKDIQTIVPIQAIESKLSDFDLLSYYFGINKTGLYKSPFRADSKPSFGIFEYNGRLRFKDFATSESGSVYEMIMRKENLDFPNTLKKIAKDFKIKSENIKFNSFKPNTQIPIRVAETKKKDTKIEVRMRNWADYDKSYWSSYGIDIDFLKKFDIYPIDYYWINGNCFRANKYAYVYIEFVDSVPYYKIYQPLVNDKRFKWFNNYPKDTISLINKVNKKAKNIIIASSVKDALCLWCNLGIPSISPQGEGFDINLETLRSEFNANFYVLYDNDERGLMYADIISEKLDIPNIILPQFDGGKDLSDMFKALGKKKFVEILESAINTAIRMNDIIE